MPSSVTASPLPPGMRGVAARVCTQPSFPWGPQVCHPADPELRAVKFSAEKLCPGAQWLSPPAGGGVPACSGWPFCGRTGQVTRSNPL